MTNIRLLSDLHLEFGPLVLRRIGGEENTVLILAGDIGIANRPRTYESFLEKVSNWFQDVIVILGNHEHYRGSILRSYDKIKDHVFNELGLSNVHVLEDELIRTGDVTFIGSTMWTNFKNADPLLMYDAKNMMNDYRMIRTGPRNEPYRRKLEPLDTLSLHMRSVDFIFDTIAAEKAKGQKVCVATHHAPSFLSAEGQYKNDHMNGAYMTELGDRIVDAEPELWVHGHTHVSHAYQIGETMVVCNPRGYYPNDENPDFDPNLTLII